MNTAIEHGTRPASGADLASAELTNPLIKDYLTFKGGLDRMVGLRNRVTATLTDIFSQPLTPPSSPLRLEEYPSKADIPAKGSFEASLVEGLTRFAKKVSLIGTPLVAAGCFPTPPQEINKPAIVESAKPVSTATAIGIGAVFVPTGNEEADQIQKRLSDPATRSSVSEEDILKFNQVVAKRAQATAEAGGIPKEVPTPVPTEAQKPLAPEIKVAPVEIFPKEMDPYIEIVDYLNPKKVHVLIVGIKRLPEGMEKVPVSAPIGGGLRNATNNPNYAEVGDLNDLTLTSFAFKGFNLNPDKNVEPGNNIGVLKDIGYRDRLGDKVYIATIDVSTKNPSTKEWDNQRANEKVREYFPRAPIVSAEYTPPQTSNTPIPEINQMVAFEKEKPAGLR